ncbi:MAG: hypothetical protein WDZ64_00555 [Parcubacteria group bacterium]
MSHTTSRGVFGASHWISVSQAVVLYLDYLLGTYREMEKVEVPTSAIQALRGLLSSALLTAKSEPMQSSTASINDYLVVREVMRRWGWQSLEREDVGRTIQEYSSLLDRLTRPHEMKNLSRELVVRARIFFCNLQHQGEIEHYDSRMRQANPHNHPKDSRR